MTTTQKSPKIPIYILLKGPSLKSPSLKSPSLKGPSLDGLILNFLSFLNNNEVKKPGNDQGNDQVWNYQLNIDTRNMLLEYLSRLLNSNFEKITYNSLDSFSDYYKIIPFFLHSKLEEAVREATKRQDSLYLVRTEQGIVYALNAYPQLQVGLTDSLKVRQFEKFGSLPIWKIVENAGKYAQNGDAQKVDNPFNTVAVVIAPEKCIIYSPNSDDKYMLPQGFSGSIYVVERKVFM
ncbi:MAG: hypothetical protein QXM96_00495 [Candidatus Woesearchaeota archaeon]